MKQIAPNPKIAVPNVGHHSVKNGLTRSGSSVSVLIAHSTPIIVNFFQRSEKKIDEAKTLASQKMQNLEKLLRCEKNVG